MELAVVEDGFFVFIPSLRLSAGSPWSRLALLALGCIELCHSFLSVSFQALYSPQCSFYLWQTGHGLFLTKISSSACLLHFVKGVSVQSNLSEVTSWSNIISWVHLLLFQFKQFFEDVFFLWVMSPDGLPHFFEVESQNFSFRCPGWLVHLVGLVYSLR